MSVLSEKREDNKNDNMSRTNLSIKMSRIFSTFHSLEDRQFAIKWGHHRYNQAPTQLVLKKSKLTHFNDLCLQAWCHFYRMSINIFCLHYKRHKGGEPTSQQDEQVPRHRCSILGCLHRANWWMLWGRRRTWCLSDVRLASRSGIPLWGRTTRHGDWPLRGLRNA